MRNLILPILLVLTAPAFAQQHQDQHPGVPGTKSTPAKALPPISQAEASAVFAKTGKIMKSVLQLKTDLAPFPSSSAIATRDQMVRHLSLIVDYVEPKFKFTLPKMQPKPAIMTLKDPAVRQIAERLEALGVVDRYGPLATSKGEGLTPSEFGDAIGLLIARVAELTHMPMTKFSPYLMPP